MSAGTGERVQIPDWLTEWPSVVDGVRQIEHLYQTPDHLVVLRRLATDARMKNVWRFLTSRNRTSGTYLHPAKQGEYLHPARQGEAETADDAQARALRDTLRTAFSATIDQRRVGTMDEVVEAQERLRSEAKVLRSVAEDIFASLKASPHADRDNFGRWIADAQALRRVADWRDGLAAMARTADDPITIQNHRGDDLGRGVAITMGAFFLETFGDRFDGVSATVASVSCDVVVDRQAVRHAHSMQRGS